MLAQQDVVFREPEVGRHQLAPIELHLLIDNLRAVLLSRHTVERLPVNTGPARMAKGLQRAACEVLLKERSQISGDVDVAVDPQAPVVFTQVSMREDLDPLRHSVGIDVAPVKSPDAPATRSPL